MRKWGLLAGLLAFAANAGPPAATNPSYRVERLVTGSAFHTINGLAFDAAGNLYAASLGGESIYSIGADRRSVTTVVGPPAGESDDLVVTRDGALIWTGLLEGIVRRRDQDGTIRDLATDIAGVNSIALSPDGRRLFVGQMFLGDGLWEVDPQGRRPARLVRKDLGGLNGFSVGADGMIYGPIWNSGSVVKIDPDTGAMDTLATGFGRPGAVRFAADGALLVLDDASGRLWRLDKAGARRLLAQLSSATDNMAVAPDGRIFVSNMADNSIQIVDPRSGSVQLLMKGALAFPRDIAFAGGRLYVSDTFAFRAVDPRSGTVRDLARAVRDDLHAPTAISASRSHVVLVSEYLGVVQIADPATGKLGAVTAGFDRPSDAVELDDGRLVVAEPYGARLVLVSGKDRSVLAEGLGTPSGLADGQDGWLYVAESSAGLVSRIRIADGRREVVINRAGAPRAVALTKDGLFVLDGAGHRLLLRERSGRVVTLARDLPVGHLSLPFVRSGGIAAGPDGTVYVAADRENAIYAVRRRH